MNNLKHRILALMTCGAAAVSMLPAMPLPASAAAPVFTAQQQADLLAQIPLSQAQSIKEKFEVPDYCEAFKLYLPFSELERLAANKLNTASPDEEHPLTGSQIEEALEIGFAASVLPDAELYGATGETGFAYVVQLNDYYRERKDSASKLLAYIQNHIIAKLFISLNLPPASLAEISSYKRIDGLHEVYDRRGDHLPADTQFYFSSEKNLMIRVDETGHSGMQVTLDAPEDMDYDAQKAHVAALAADFFGPSCKLTAQKVYLLVDIDINAVVDPAPAATRYEITLPKQDTALQSNAEKLMQMLVREGETPYDCIFYPEFGYFDFVTPNCFNYNSGTKQAIDAYLEKNAPEYSLEVTDNGTTMLIKKTDAAYEKTTSVYVQLFNDLGFWPENIASGGSHGHDFGIHLNPDYKEKGSKACSWESPYGKNTESYSNLTRFVTDDDSYRELYKSGTKWYSFRVLDSSVAFVLKEGSTISYDDLEKLIREASGMDSFTLRQQSNFYIVSANERTFPADASAIKKALAEKGLIEAFYDPGNVANVNPTIMFETGEHGELYYYKSGNAEDEKRVRAAKEWLAEYYPKCTFEDDYPDRDVKLGRSDSYYFAVTPDPDDPNAENDTLISELYHILGQFPREVQFYVHEEVYAVRNNSLNAVEPAAPVSCEWLDPIGWGTDVKDHWKNLQKIETMGMFSGDAYIYEEGDMLQVFKPAYYSVGCMLKMLNTPNETVYKQVEAIAKKYQCFVEQSDGLIVITLNSTVTSFSEEKLTALRKELMETGLIDAFFMPGDIATVDSVGLAQKDALYYTYENNVKSEKLLSSIKSLIAQQRPGYTVEETTDNTLGRADTVYIKVTPDKEADGKELFTVASLIWAECSVRPQLSIMLPNRPVYAVRNDSMAVRGDMNMDGTADVADAVMIARYAAEDSELVITDKGRKNADLQNDGNVDSKDLTLLLRAIAKQITL